MRLFYLSLLLIIFFSCSNSKTKRSNLLDFVPKNTSLIVKTSNLENVTNSINNSDFILRFSKTATFKNLEEKLNRYQT